MSNESNSDRKPQLSGILTEPLNPRAVRFVLRSKTKSMTSGLVILDTSKSSEILNICLKVRKIFEL